MAEAAQTAAKGMAGRSLHRVLLRCKEGQVVATDGHQLLVQGGFHFPWDDELIIPRIDAWASRELSQERGLIGRSDTHLFIRVGAWSFALRIDADARFPSIEAVIPAAREMRTRLQLKASSIHQLKKDLGRIPGNSREPIPLILMVGRPVKVHAQTDEGGVIEFGVSDAEVQGIDVSVRLDGRKLARALKLGFTEIGIAKADRPVCCRDAERVFVWMPLGEPTNRPPAASQPSAVRSPMKESKQMSETNGHQVAGEDSSMQALDPFAEAEALKNLLGDVQTRLHRLLTALNQHRRQARAVRAAMQSLRHLQLDS